MTDDLVLRKPQRRVVCAAIRSGTLIIPGPRHFDSTMHALLEFAGLHVPEAEQGFIDQWGNFMDRKEALDVALAANQLTRVKTQPFNELFSEDLY
jgi:hypothetical protein